MSEKYPDISVIYYYDTLFSGIIQIGLTAVKHNFNGLLTILADILVNFNAFHRPSASEILPNNSLLSHWSPL